MSTESTERDPFSHAVIGKAMETHRELGPGLDEKFYHQLHSQKLTAAGIEHQSKPRRELVYRGMVADVFEPDLVFPGRMIGELKVLRGTFAPAHLTQLLSYLKLWEMPTGMLFDFDKESLIFQRVAYTRAAPRPPSLEVPQFVTTPDVAALLLRLLNEILAAHGVGYCDTTYHGLLVAALTAERVPFQRGPLCQIGALGPAALRCLVIANGCVVSISALGDGLTAADRAAVQTYLRLLGLPWGLAVHFGRREMDVRFVVRPRGSGPTDSERPQIGEGRGLGVNLSEP